ncbi:hypothetical protein QAD02_011695 [Eretmocerus hayati]|uniref:Uncharacterized protein n=1 Tax=Eretmocerus hayati TaxID=131215 RepID=A0ACC2NXA1_9HYME|nr:hypothetical protein QAD02_011695 [Eretmocerus hayati]
MNETRKRPSSPSKSSETLPQQVEDHHQDHQVITNDEANEISDLRESDLPREFVKKKTIETNADSGSDSHKDTMSLGDVLALARATIESSVTETFISLLKNTPKTLKLSYR